MWYILVKFMNYFLLDLSITIMCGATIRVVRTFLEGNLYIIINYMIIE
jgi:hypothetical protein